MRLVIVTSLPQMFLRDITHENITSGWAPSREVGKLAGQWSLLLQGVKVVEKAIMPVWKSAMRFLCSFHEP